uniref:Vacuolar protein 8 n=1 Tax=Hanusia phi TaxID=3032 RepID=A0A7S0EKW4_9CRYP
MARSSMTRSQKRASAALAKISDMGEEQCLEMAEQGVIAVTVGNLSESKNAVVRLNSAKILKNLSKYATNRPQLIEEGAARTMVELFRHKKPRALHLELVHGVNELGQGKEARPQLVEAVPYIIKFVQTADLVRQMLGLSAIGRIAEHEECQFKIMKMGAMHLAFQYVQSEFHTYKHKSLAMKILAEISTSIACHKYILGYEDKQGTHIISRLCRIKDEEMVPFCAKTVERLVVEEKNAKAFVEKGVLKEFLWMLAHSTPTVVLGALDALGALARFPPLQRVIVEWKFLPLVCPLTSNPHEALRISAVKLLALLAQHPQNKARIIYNGAHEVLLYHGEHSSYPDVKELARLAAADLLNLPEARLNKTLQRAAYRFKDNARNALDDLEERMSNSSQKDRGKELVAKILKQQGQEEESSDDEK